MMLVKGDADDRGPAKQAGPAGDESLCCLDYEWVFDFPVPAHFVQDVYKRQIMGCFKPCLSPV